MTHPNDIFHKGGRIGVLLIHGLAGTPKEMDSIGMRLHKYGFTVYIPVLPGHCGGAPELLVTDRDDWYAAVDAAYHKLKAETDVVFAGGLSAGALLGILLARRYPEMRGIVLYSITFKWDGWSVPKRGALLPLLLRIPYFRNRYRFAETYPYGIKDENLRERIIMKLESGDTSAAGHVDTPGKILYEMLRIGGLAKKALPLVKTPALIVHAEEDDLTSIKNALYVQKHIGGANELLALKDSYHLVTVDQERNEVAKATARYFRAKLNAAELTELDARAVKRLK